MRNTGQVPATGPYAFCSGAPHAGLWRLAFGPDGTKVIIPRAPREFARAASAVAWVVVTGSGIAPKNLRPLG